MKKTLFLMIICLLFSINSFAQHSIILNDASQIDMPSEIENINHDQARLHAETNFSSSHTIRNSILNRKTNHMFRVNGILISLFTDDHPVTEDHLSKLKTTFDHLYGQQPSYNYNSRLQNVNNNSILVIKYTLENVVNYRFFAYNTSNTKSITGILEFNSAEDTKATSLLNNIIKGIRFKNN